MTERDDAAAETAGSQADGSDPVELSLGAKAYRLGRPGLVLIVLWIAWSVLAIAVVGYLWSAFQAGPEVGAGPAEAADWPPYSKLYGFVASFLIVPIAFLVGAVLKRKDGYYDD